MNPIVKQAIQIAKERYHSIGDEAGWSGLSPDDIFLAVQSQHELWLTYSFPQRREIMNAMKLRLAPGYKLDRRFAQNFGMRLKRSLKRMRHKSVILARDGFACAYCGAMNIKLHIDHVWPRSKGGPDIAGNLITACEACNLAKSNNTLPNEQEWLAKVSTSNKRINLPDDAWIEL